MWSRTLLFAATASALSSPYSDHAGKTNSSGLEVDLGYSVYRGVHNASANLNVFQGIRFAASTEGKGRWQPPRAPETNRSAVIDADAPGTQCPQAMLASDEINLLDNSGNSEDCLFLNVYAPTNVSIPGNATTEPGLPVVVWIHGGGYGNGAGASDLTPLIQNNDNAFITVGMNYRLNAFGFLSSDEVARRGVANAGLLDQQMAMHWVQSYIHLFGGNPRRVTLFGASAGGGSVMLHDIAYGGTLGTQLFRNSISSSPYVAFQYGYKDWQPSQAYYALAAAAGCDAGNAYLKNGSKPIFDCLQEVDSATLMEAADRVSQSGTWGSFAFLPVTDGHIIQERPSEALAQGKLNGLNHLTGHNALEGASWVAPESIETVDDFVEWAHIVFPNFDNNDLAKLMHYYPASNASTDFDAPLWSTAGDSGPTTVNQSIAATGQQQRAIAIYGETTFICPSYWIAEAYSDNILGGQGWKYQWSVPNGYHGADGAGYVRWPYTSGYYNADLIIAFMRMLGAFITTDVPHIPNTVANGVSRNDSSPNPINDWKPYSLYEPTLFNVNTTCPGLTTIGDLPYCTGDSMRNSFRLADAYAWEGGRGERCDFWRAMGEKVPE
ncbi:hypothetical protein MBLNU230_g5572t1 [Neophaeotheca triangularis]